MKRIVVLSIALQFSGLAYGAAEKQKLKYDISYALSILKDNHTSPIVYIKVSPSTESYQLTSSTYDISTIYSDILKSSSAVLIFRKVGVQIESPDKIALKIHAILKAKYQKQIAYKRKEP